MPIRQGPTEYESRQPPPQPGVTAKTPGIAVLLSMIFPGGTLLREQNGIGRRDHFRDGAHLDRCDEVLVQGSDRFQPA